MFKLKFTKFVILKNKYNCYCYISGLYLCSEVICEACLFRIWSFGCFKRKQREVRCEKNSQANFEFQIEKYNGMDQRPNLVSGGMDQRANLG